MYHPDKCDAPGTDDAFKAIGHAFAVLSNEEKRKQFDQFGIDSESRASSSQSFRQHPFAQPFEGEITPEDLFNMFFNNMQGNGKLLDMFNGKVSFFNQLDLVLELNFILDIQGDKDTHLGLKIWDSFHSFFSFYPSLSCSCI
jgi:DnaJ-class molecular chaperone